MENPPFSSSSSNPSSFASLEKYLKPVSKSIGLPKSGPPVRELSHSYICNIEAYTLVKQQLDSPLTNTPWFKTTLEATAEYAESFANFSSSEIAESLRNKLVQEGVTNKEAVLLCTLLPLTSDEAKSLIPSLLPKSDDELEAILSIINESYNAESIDDI